MKIRYRILKKTERVFIRKNGNSIAKTIKLLKSINWQVKKYVWFIFCLMHVSEEFDSGATHLILIAVTCIQSVNESNRNKSVIC